MTQSTLTRRSLLASSTVVAAGLALASRPASAQSMIPAGGENSMAGPATTASDPGIAMYVPEESEFTYEVERTPAEWRAHLDNDEYAYQILRRGKTEKPKTTELWKEAYDGEYHCRGCDQALYEGRWFQPLNKGWVFFHHAKVNAVLFGLDGPVPQYGQAGMAISDDNAIAEVHCSRCGSHVGHHLLVSGMFLHCINGTALKLV